MTAKVDTGNADGFLTMYVLERGLWIDLLNDTFIGVVQPGKGLSVFFFVVGSGGWGVGEGGVVVSVCVPLMLIDVESLNERGLTRVSFPLGKQNDSIFKKCFCQGIKQIGTVLHKHFYSAHKC